MGLILEILIDLFSGLWGWPSPEKRSTVGESELDRSARRYGQIVVALLVLAIVAGVAGWIFLVR